MNANEIIEKFESKDSFQIWEATWAILSCNDANEIGKLKDLLPHFQVILSQVEMGGAFRSNAKSAEVAFRYIENTCNHVCRCALYTRVEFFNPRREEENSFISILESKIYPELYEELFLVICKNCGKKLKVREILGGHYPMWDWRILSHKGGVDESLTTNGW